MASYYSNPYVSGPPPPGPRIISPTSSTTVVEETVVAPPPMRPGEYQLLNAGPRYWEETYLLPPVTDDEIAQIPPPKDTHFHINDDPSLGGETWRVPTPKAPMSDFNNACRATPVSDEFTRVIPWDHKKKDYVYGAVHDHIFRGRYDRRRLKRKLDHVKQHGSWDPTGSYNKCFICCLLAGALFLITWILLWAYRPYCWWCSLFSNNWIWFLLPLFAIMICCTWCCICRAAANHATRNRYRYVKHALDDVNDRHLKGSGVYLRPGTKAAWLEVDMDPDRTEVVGDVVDDFRLYNGEEHVKMVEQEVERREDMDARAQIPIENRPKREAQFVEEVIDGDEIEEEEFVEETTVVGPAGPGQPMTVHETITPSRTSVVEERVVTNDPVVVSTGRSFYERLRASKMGNSELLSGQGNVNNISRNENEVGVSDKQLSFYQKLKKSK